MDYNEENITYENIVDYAIVNGYQSGINLFMEELNQSLYVNAVIEEAGGIDNLVTEMLAEYENSGPDFEHVTAKLDSLMQ